MVTQKQIAEELGISRQLVTFALAGYPLVSVASRKRILAAAKKMGYRPNPHARALKHASTGLIALWVPDQISSYYSRIARELNLLVKNAHRELIVSEVANRTAEETLSHVPVDAIFAVNTPKAVRAHLDWEAVRSVPVISIGSAYFDKIDCVQVDLRTGTKEVMKHLISSGFHRIVHATFVTKDQPDAVRRLGYSQAMARAGLKSEFFYYPLSEDQRPVVRRLIQDYVRKCGCPEAIFCHSDDAALGIYRGLRDLNLRVPLDVALVGCDGIEDTEYLECPLTTLVQPVREMCATAWKFLENRLMHPKTRRQYAVLRPQLVIRESSGHVVAG